MSFFEAIQKQEERKNLIFTFELNIYSAYLILRQGVFPETRDDQAD